MKSTLFLDGLRGLAAFHVVVGHARWLLWEGYSEGYLLHPETYSLFDKLVMYFFSLFRFGHEMVLFFFVLSGFVIHLRYAKQLKKDRSHSHLNFLNFFYRRIKRLYPPFLLSIILSFLISTVGIAYELPLFTSSSNYFSIDSNVNIELGYTTLLGNLIFMMDVYFPVFGGNGPAWSLMYEWWFYMIYPFFWILTKKISLLASTGLVVSLFILTLSDGLIPIFLLEKVFGLMVTWWFGVLLAEVYVKRIPVNMLQALCSFIVIALTIYFLTSAFIPKDIFWGCIFGALLALCFFLQEKGIKLTILEKFKILGDFSYTLYISHFPILLLLSALLISKFGQLPSHFFFVILGVLFVLLTSFVFHLFVEKPFVKKRQRFLYLTPTEKISK